MIYYNKSVWSRIDKFKFGLACLGDALIRVFSLGMLYSNFKTNISKNATIRAFTPSVKQRK